MNIQRELRNEIEIIVSRKLAERVYLVSLVKRTLADEHKEGITIFTEEKVVHEYAEGYAQKRRPPIRSHRPFIQKVNNKTYYWITRDMENWRPDFPIGTYVEVWEMGLAEAKELVINNIW